MRNERDNRMREPEMILYLLSGHPVPSSVQEEIENIVRSLLNAHDILARALDEKDKAMSILFQRLDKAGVDYSDLV